MKSYTLYVALGYGATALVLLWLGIGSWWSHRQWRARQRPDP